uniref:Calmodulin-binding domain-containing protein n=1 Tax=Leersia perrieri TaxID=77586 RepID=A0A0D9VA90_9ORYZ
MVQRKQTRKKPKDSGFGGGGGGDPGSRGGGGGGIVRTAAALPNYMRATSSSGARAGPGREETAAPPRRKRDAAKAAAAPPYVSRATCSSAMRGLTGAGAGGGEAHVCPYSYCSFKCHADAVPLRTLVAASRRRLIKTQQSMKLKGASPFRKPTTTNGGGAGGDGFFVEIYAGDAAPMASSDVTCSDLSTEEDMDAAGFDRRNDGYEEDKAKDSDGSVDGSCGSSDVISGGSVDLFVTKSRGGCKREIDGEKGIPIYMDQEAEDFGACKSDISEELNANYQDGGVDGSNGSSIDEISSAFGGMNFKEECSDHPGGAASSQRKKWNISRRTTAEQVEKMRAFNPRAPNFLPLEPDPEAEKVDLRHQMMGDRKNSEEWMVDYALRRAVNKLARAQKRKVEMLVQAFETVLPPAADEKKYVQQDDDKKSFRLAKNAKA